MLNWPMVALGWVINLFQRGLASYRRILEILDTTPAIASPKSRVAPGSGPGGPAQPVAEVCRGEIEFRRLTFAYPGTRRPALRDVSFTVPAGRTVAIVGRTGAGKSTLLALLPRLFEPPPGTVLIDGCDVRSFDLHVLRSRIAAAPQDAFLFSATLAENIAYGVEQASAEMIERAARTAGLDGDVSAFTNGFATRVGERGITLSGGQKQRTTIARAVLRDAPILLLDDCLSSVDTHTEEVILRALRGEMARRTTLLVSHRVSTVRDADQIVVLDDGAVVERGTHEALLARGGHYAELYRQQQIEEELEAS